MKCLNFKSEKESHLSFFETKERNFFIANYLNRELESFSFCEKEFYFIITDGEIGQQLSSLVEINESVVTSEFIDFLENLSEIKKYKRINFRITPSMNTINSDVLKLLLLRGYNTQLSFTSLVSLDLSESAIWSSLRKSFKSLINKESRQVATKFYDHASTENYLFSDWISIYSNAIKRGNKKLSDEAIAITYDTIKNNLGFVVLAYEDNVLLGAILFNYHKGLAYYSAAANSDSIEVSKDRHIGHLLMWQGIKRLKEIGCHVLEIGPLDFAGQFECEHDTKVLNITNFKLGFGGSVVPVFNFTKAIFLV